MLEFVKSDYYLPDRRGKKFASVERSHCFGFAADVTSTSATR